MALKIDNDWRIESDSQSWNLILERYGEINETTGKPMRTHEISYHPNIRAALSHYVDQELKAAPTVDAVIEILDRLNKRIDNMNEHALRALTQGRAEQ